MLRFKVTIVVDNGTIETIEDNDDTQQILHVNCASRCQCALQRLAVWETGSAGDLTGLFGLSSFE
jgi:hypothetical protein